MEVGSYPITFLHRHYPDQVRRSAPFPLFLRVPLSPVSPSSRRHSHLSLNPSLYTPSMQNADIHFLPNQPSTSTGYKTGNG
jgi:hypothetical protein